MALQKQVVIGDLNLSGSSEEIRSFAQKRAQECGRKSGTWAALAPGALAACTEIADRYEIKTPSPDRYSHRDCLKRLCDPKTSGNGVTR